MNPSQPSHVYLCGCRSDGATPPDLCPEHGKPYVTLTATYRVGRRCWPLREANLEDVLARMAPAREAHEEEARRTTARAALEKAASQRPT